MIAAAGPVYVFKTHFIEKERRSIRTFLFSQLLVPKRERKPTANQKETKKQLALGHLVTWAYISQHIISNHFISWHIVSCHIISCDIIS